jgi:hypothetical protein
MPTFAESTTEAAPPHLSKTLDCAARAVVPCAQTLTTPAWQAIPTRSGLDRGIGFGEGFAEARETAPQRAEEVWV